MVTQVEELFAQEGVAWVEPLTVSRDNEQCQTRGRGLCMVKGR